MDDAEGHGGDERRPIALIDGEQHEGQRWEERHAEKDRQVRDASVVKDVEDVVTREHDERAHEAERREHRGHGHARKDDYEQDKRGDTERLLEELDDRRARIVREGVDLGRVYRPDDARKLLQHDHQQAHE